jgi:hypothetical protein
VARRAARHLLGLLAAAALAVLAAAPAAAAPRPAATGAPPAARAAQGPASGPSGGPVSPTPRSGAWPGGAVSGRVLDRAGRPLAGASVHASGTRTFVRTGEEGRFRIPYVPAGTFSVVAGAEGHAFASVPLEDPSITLRLPAETPATVPLPDYPRPDLDRRTATGGRWLSLNGSWSFDFDPRGTGEREGWTTGRRKWGKVIRVPFGWQSLAAFGEEARGSDQTFAGPFAAVKGDGWYKRDFTVPREFPRDGPVALRFGAADWTADVWLDGRPVAHHENGYSPFEADLGRLPAGSTHTLVVRVREVDNSARTPYPSGKQMGWYTDTGGLWQSVWLEPRTRAALTRTDVTPRLDFSGARPSAALDLAVRATGAPAGTVAVTVRRLGVIAPSTRPLGARGSVVARTTLTLAGGAARGRVAVPAPELWEPDRPALYSVTLRLSGPGGARDEVVTTTGLRRIERRWAPGHSPADTPDPQGQYQYIVLNDHPLYLRSALDQAFNPWGVYTYTGLYQGPDLRSGSLNAPGRGSVLFDLRAAKRLGFNSLRTHIKPNDPLYYDAADRLGLLIWQDMPNFGYEGFSPQAERLFERVLRDEVARDRNHASIVVWDDFNEAWGLGGGGPIRPETVPFLLRMVGLTRSLDDSRLLVDNSPCCENFHLTSDLNDWHNYIDSWSGWQSYVAYVVGSTFPGSSWNYGFGRRQDGAPLLNSEFGPWSGGPERDQDVSWPFKFVIDLFRAQPKMDGYLFTELSDIEFEWNGWVTYDRTRQAAGYVDHAGRLRDADLVNADDAVVLAAPPVRSVAPGDRVVTPAAVSAFGREPIPAGATLRWSLSGTDALGRRVDTGLAGALPVSPRPYDVTRAGEIAFAMPGGVRAARLHAWVEAAGRTWAESFTDLESTDQTPPAGVSLRLDPSAPTRQDWSQGAGVVSSSGATSAWGQGTGASEYALEVPAGLDARGVTSATLTFEASARRPPWPRTTYPQTSERRFPTRLTVSVGGVPAGSVTLPDDPADSRGALSYANGPEPGQWGYRVTLPVRDVAALRARLAKGSPLRVRFAARDGGLTLLGRRTGRYGIEPTLTLGTGAPAARGVEGEEALATGDTPPYLTLAAPRLASGREGEIEARLTNPTARPLRAARFAALLPPGWAVAPSSATTGAVAPGATRSVTWRVTPPKRGADAEQLAAAVRAQVTFTRGGRRARLEQSLANVLPAPPEEGVAAAAVAPRSGSRGVPRGARAPRAPR